MKKLVFHFIFLFIISPIGAQTIITRDPEISRMVDEISSERIENYIRTLVSFHTRHNLSNRDNPSQGIGAAWNWVKSEQEKPWVSGGQVLPARCFTGQPNPLAPDLSTSIRIGDVLS